MIEWFARNSVAANLLMVTIILIGCFSAARLIPVEVFPSFEVQAVSVSTVFRGATPDAVEDGITTRIEEAIFDIEGIEEIISTSSEGSSLVIAELDENYDKRELLNEIKLKVDALNTLPVNAENSVVTLSVRNPAVIQVAVVGETDTGSITLRLAAENVREELLALRNITLVELQGISDHEISIEVRPETLDNFGLSLLQISQAIQAGSADVSAGNVKTSEGDVSVRTDGQAYTAEEFAQIPIITTAGSDPILLGELANIKDGFEDKPILTRFNGRPAIMIDVSRTGKQSSIDIASTVRGYIQDYNERNSGEITLNFWDDDSVTLKGRLSTLINSGIWGGILVLLLLSLFLRPAIAFWVFLGVPMSFMGAFIFMPLVGGTFNLMSLFAFITVLGIVVDDAIVTGENIYSKMRDGVEPIQASIVGTKEIAIPVTFGVLTTMVAFLPMANLGANRIGYIAAQIPLVVIPVLVFSLIESKLILPAHLSHVKPRSENAKSNLISRIQLKVSRGFEESILAFYKPFLEKCLHNKSIALTTVVAVSAIIVTFATTGHLKYTFFPRVESEEIRLSLAMPDTTGFATTHENIQHISKQILDLQEKYRDPATGVSIIRHTYSTTGTTGRTVKPSIGTVRAELIGPEDRHIKIGSNQLAREIRERVGIIPGAEQLNVRSELGRGGEPIDVELTGLDLASMRVAGDKIRKKLREYPYVFDIQDNFSGGKEELNIELKPNATVLGLSLADIARQVRGSVFGLESQRIQRGRDEVRVMVRLPLENRSSIEDLNNLPIRTGPQNEPIPLSDLANIKPVRSPTTLYRVNRSAIINVTADVDKEKADVPAILRDLRLELEQETAQQPGLKFKFKGESEEQSENNEGFKSGTVLVLVAIYALLAIPFKSYTQPLIVMSVIPFSVVGAILGHMITGYNLSILSIIGMLALLGVVVNDSLVLVDYINQQRAKGVAVFEAVLNSGARRFRPVILTSITTFAGLTPLLLDQSTQSQFLVPMAVSLGFGILFATCLTLVVVPVNYLVAYNFKHASRRIAKKVWVNWLEYWNKPDYPDHRGQS